MDQNSCQLLASEGVVHSLRQTVIEVFARVTTFKLAEEVEIVCVCRPESAKGSGKSLRHADAVKSLQNADAVQLKMKCSLAHPPAKIHQD